MTPQNCAASTESASLIATSRTYNNADPTKTYGQTVPSSWTSINFTRTPSVIAGVRHTPGVSPGYRSNVGVANLSTISINLNITTFRADGSVAGFATKSVPALSLSQWGLSDLGVSSLGIGGRVEVLLDQTSIRIDPCNTDQSIACMNRCDTQCNGKYGFASTGTFMTYASKIDNGSGDAEYIAGQLDYMAYNRSCEALTGSAAAAGLLKRYGIDPGYGTTFKKVPRTKR